ncbi:MAG TPA: SRPBCC family protein [Solirubrobacteraceae bacterium]
MPRLSFSHDYAQPVERVFDFLAEHENLSVIFPGKVTRVRDGEDGTRNGVGSTRALSMGPGPKVIETNTVVVPNERIEYKITGGVPVKHHYGTMVFTPRPDGGTHLQYDIELDLHVPGAGGAIGALLKSSVNRGLRKVEQLA